VAVFVADKEESLFSFGPISQIFRRLARGPKRVAG
jgi:hypothetical protein